MVFARIAATVALTTFVLSSRRPNAARAVPIRTSVGDRHERFPVLRRIDRARIDRDCPLADNPTAEQLEARARQLTDEFLSEVTWLTGSVSEPGWNLFTGELDRFAERPIPTSRSRGRMDC